MHTIRRARLPFPILILAGLALARIASAGEVRTIATDDQGVTLRVDLPPWKLLPVRGGERSLLRAGTLPESDAPGRPGLPFATALIAIPPGALPQAVVIGGEPEQVQENVWLAVGARPTFRDDGRGGFEPTRVEVPAIADGPWPASSVDMGTPFTVRRQHVVSVRIRPFRYDEASHRLWSRSSITVRVSWGSAGGARAIGLIPPERGPEPVLQSVVLNFDQGRRWRLPPSQTLSPFGPSLLARRPGQALVQGAQAFDENAPEVRVRVDTTGLYGLDYARLSAAGFPANLPISELSVHRHEFVEGQLTPYVTIELPIEVEDRDNSGTFNLGDRILVYAQNWFDRANPSRAQRHWGDGDAIFVTSIPGGLGARVLPRSGWRNNGAPSLPSYPWTQRWEKNFNSINFPADTNTDQFHWTEFNSYYDRPDTLVFETNHLDATHTTTVSVTYQGRREASHWSWVHVRNGSGLVTPVVDSAQWFGRGVQVFSAILPGTALTEGRTNAVRSFGKPFFGDPDLINNNIDYVSVNYFDVTYWRAFRALRGHLPCNSADAAGECAITATGFTDSTRLRAWDVTNPLDPRRLTGVIITKVGAEFTLALQDSVDPAARHRYVVFDTPRLPPASKFSPVTRPRLENATAADIIYIVPEFMRAAITPLAALRKQQGLDTLVATLEGVNDEFGGGRKSDYAIRRFLKYAYDRPDWNTAFVVLVGDGSEDPQNFWGTSGVDWVPIHKIPGPVNVSTGDGFFREITPSDFWYVWALQYPSPPTFGSVPSPVPDLYLGRLAVKDVNTLNGVVAKLIAYESVDSTQTWRRRMLLHSDDAYSEEGLAASPGSRDYCRKNYEVVFENINDVCRGVVENGGALALSEIEHFKQSYLLRDQKYVYPGANGDTCRLDIFATRAAARTLVTAPLLARLNDGRLWWNYQGHANEKLVAHEYVYLDGPDGDDKQSFTNYGKPFFYSGFSCHPNAFAKVREDDSDHGPSYGEDLVNLAGRGAIASWASVGYELVPSIPAAGSHLNVWMAKSLFSDPPPDFLLPDRNAGSGAGARVVLGEAIALTLIRNYAATQGDFFEDEVAFSYHLLGDPATHLTIGAPMIVVTANGQPVTDGQPVRLASGGDTLRLEADIVSNVRIAQITLEGTGASGTVVVPSSDYTLTPAFPDTVGGGVYDGRRFHLLYNTSQCDQSYTLRITDRQGVTSTFRIVFRFDAQLTLDHAVLREDAPVPADANAVTPSRLAMLVLSPCRLNPLTDLELKVDQQHQDFVPVPARNDTTGRVFELQWVHAPYAVGPHTVELLRTGTSTAIHTFRVESGMRLAHVMNFPDPFEEKFGTRFLFTLLSDQPADVMIRVFTISGRMIWERSEKGLTPGEHEWPWDGLDREGHAIANGVYLYRIQATNSRGSVRQDSRLVKLRNPRHSDDTASNP